MRRDREGSDCVSIKVLATKFSNGFALSQVKNKSMSTFVHRMMKRAKSQVKKLKQEV